MTCRAHRIPPPRMVTIGQTPLFIEAGCRQTIIYFRKPEEIYYSKKQKFVLTRRANRFRRFRRWLCDAVGSICEELTMSRSSPPCPTMRTSMRGVAAFAEMGWKRPSRLLIDDGAIAARQCNDELGKCAGFSLDVDPAAMLLDNNVMRHRKAESCSFPGRFGGEEGIEHLLSYFGRNPAAIVANSDFDCPAEVFRRRAEDWLKGFLAGLDLASGCRIEAVGNQI